MKRINLILAIALGLLLVLTIGTGKAQAAIGNDERIIGLHDHILTIHDIRIIDGDTKVPLADMEKYLYLSVTTEDGKTVIGKNGKQFIYDAATGLTIMEGREEPWKPIVDINGSLFISVKYLARGIGFKMDYLPNVRTLRIYRDDYEHMNHGAYELMVKKVIENAKPAPPAKPTKPSTPANPNKKAVVYLTFDDGPNQFTLKNNDTLNKYKAPATFFFIGNEMKHQPSIVKKMAKSDHSIGTHSMSHNQKLVYQSTNGFIAEMSGAAELLAKQSGKQSKLIRVPYGSVPHVTPAMQKSLKTKGYKMWDWNVDSNDWQYKDTQADQIVKNVQAGVTKQAKAGEKQIIVLMHDRSQTAIALPKIIEWLQKEGYELKKYDPSNHISQNFLKDPEL